jgi:hypothetical protein
MPIPKPTLRFTHSTVLRAQTLKVLAAIDHDADPTLHAEALSSLVTALTAAGMEFYFLKPVKDAKLSFVARQNASLGISGAVRVMSPIVRSVLSGANGKQLRVVSKHIRALMA